MRELNCAHLLAAADAPPVRAQSIRIDGGNITSVGPTPAGTGVDPLLALPALANAHDHARPSIKLTRRRRQAARNLAALSRARAGGRSLSRKRRAARA